MMILRRYLAVLVLLLSACAGPTGPTGQLAEAADAVRRIRARGFEPEGFTMNAYAATQISVKALSAGQRTPADLFNYVRTQPFQTDIGTIRFNAQGDVQQPRVGIYRWNAGKTHEVAERAALR